MNDFDVHKWRKQQLINEGKTPQSKLNYDKVVNTLIDTLPTDNNNLTIGGMMELIEGFMEGVNETDEFQPIFELNETELLGDFVSYLERKSNLNTLKPQ